MSGYFVITRAFLLEVVRAASGVGFKVLLDQLASSGRRVRLGEVPYTFRTRVHGASKLDLAIGLEYLELIGDKLIGDFVPSRFLLFTLVGTVGLALSVALLFVLVELVRMPFMAAQIATTVLAMIANFFLNNITTYRDRRLVFGVFTFCAACSVGALINVRLASFAREAGAPWHVAGSFGLAIGAVWNYGVTSIITWRRRFRAGALAVGTAAG